MTHKEGQSYKSFWGIMNLKTSSFQAEVETLFKSMQTRQQELRLLFAFILYYTSLSFLFTSLKTTIYQKISLKMSKYDRVLVELEFPIAFNILLKNDDILTRAVKGK